MPLDVRVEGSEAHRVVRVSGECDLASAPALQEALQPLRPPDVTLVTIDASDLDFVDSTGLGVVLGAMRRLREAGGDLEIADPSPAVRKALRLTGLDKILRIT